MYTTNLNQIMLSLMISIILLTSLATITHVDKGLAQSRTSNIEWSRIILMIILIHINDKAAILMRLRTYYLLNY